MPIDLDHLVLEIIVSAIVVGPLLWVAGRIFVGKKKAKLTDALWIVALGVVLKAFLTWAFSGFIAGLIVWLMWLALVKHFFDCGWIKAILIAVIAWVIASIVAVAVAMIFGFSLWAFLRFPWT